MRAPLSQQELHDLFDLRDGVLYWRERRSIRIQCGDPAGAVVNGYLKTGINGRTYLNHRLIFLMQNGWLPPSIDHIDGNPLNNKPENLRPANKSENACNTGLSVLNTSGYKGVSFNKRSGKWVAHIRKNQRGTWLGRYDTPEEASQAYAAAAATLHGEFARLV